jgi:opacity protein-like surface antigen
VAFLRRFILACAGLLACCASAAGAPQAVAGKTQGHTAVRKTQGIEAQRQAAAIAWLGGQVYGYQRATWRWEQLMGVQKTPTEGRVLEEMSIRDVQKAVRLWKERAAKAASKARKPPHLAAFLCIHRYEGSWTDGGGPYYGGLQMDLGFQRTYAPHLLHKKGTADHWTPLEQIWVAEKAAKSRGFYPWPNTARYCGLI